MVEPRLTGQTPNNDIYRTDPGRWNDRPVYVQIMGIWDGMPPTLLAAARCRRATDITGECPFCLYVVRGVHDRSCLATDENLELLLARWERYRFPNERGTRITENPGNVVGAHVHDRLVSIGEQTKGHES